ncbi:MAG: protein kinase [Colwellia sp.]|nr:protein kinase [Colwellia sp.]
MTTANTRYKNCPQCFFQNAITNTTCDICDWLLIDDLETDKTQFLEEDPDQTQQPNGYLNDKAPEPSANTPKSKFNLTGELAHFEVLEILGQGGMGAVYRAKDKTLERNVALKLLKTKAGANQTSNVMLLDEARMACKLNHPNIVTIYDVARAQNNNFIIMEWVDGQSLDQLIPVEGLPLETALDYARQIIDGIACAHQSQIIHRDIKPQNIMLTVDGTIKVLDFGIAGLIAHNDDENKKQSKPLTPLQTGKTDTCVFTGTPGYISPEQALGRKNLGQGSDIFSFGILLYQMLTGKRPFEGENGKERNQAIIIGDYAKLPAHLPIDLRAIVDHCLAHAIEDRYQSSATLSNDLHNYLNGEPVSVIASRRYWLKKKTVKHKWPVMLLLLFSVGGITELVWQQVQAHQQQVREQLLTTFTSRVESLEAKVQMSRMAPRHDISNETALWHQQIASLNNEIQTLGEAAYGPGHYAIGRMYYALQEYDKALTHSQQAWQSGFQQARVAYNLALSHGAIYQQQKAIINNHSSKSAKKDRMALLDKAHKQPAIEYLNQGLAGSPYQSYTKALLQYYQGEEQQALTTLEQTDDLPVWFYQHHILRGDIYLAKAEKAGASHSAKDKESNAALALQHYATAAAIGRSDLQLQLKPLAVYFRQLTNAVYGKQQNFDHTYQQAISFLDKAGIISPKDYQAYFIKGQLLSRKSAYQDQHAGDPIQTQQQAIEQLQLALVYSMDNPSILFSLGRAYFQKIKLLQDRDFPVEPEFDTAINIFEQIPKQSRDYFFFNSYANLLKELAIKIAKQQQTMLVNGNKREEKKHAPLFVDNFAEHFTKAIKAYQQASALQPKRIGAKINLASIYLLWSEFIPPEQAQKKLQQAITAYKKAILLNPEHFVVNYYIGLTYRWLAKINNTLLVANTEQLTQAELYLTKAKQLQPQHPFVMVEQALLQNDQAIYHWQQGLDYQDYLSQGKSSLEQTLLKNPANRLLLDNLSLLYRMEQQLAYFQSGNINNKEVFDKALIKSQQVISDSDEDNALLVLLNNNWQSLERVAIDNLPYNDKGLLTKAEWHSQAGHFQQAEHYFNAIAQYYPSLLWLYRRQHLQRWLDATVDFASDSAFDPERHSEQQSNEEQQSLTKVTVEKRRWLKQQINYFSQLLEVNYPALVVKK